MAKNTSEIGKRIAARRQHLGLTQRELAERCGVNSITVSKWERGVVLPARKLAALEEVLLAPARWILEGVSDARVSSDQAREIARACARLEVDARKLRGAAARLADAAGGECGKEVRAVAEALKFVRTECEYIGKFLPEVMG